MSVLDVYAVCWMIPLLLWLSGHNSNLSVGACGRIHLIMAAGSWQLLWLTPHSTKNGQCIIKLACNPTQGCIRWEGGDPAFPQNFKNQDCTRKPHTHTPPQNFCTFMFCLVKGFRVTYKLKSGGLLWLSAPIRTWHQYSQVNGWFICYSVTVRFNDKGLYWRRAMQF